MGSFQNKRKERKGKLQLIDASSFKHTLRKSLGNKRNKITPEDRVIITKLYADFTENEYCKIYNNTEFMYREYAVMQPLQRSYAITRERIDAILSSGALSFLYDEAKVDKLENTDELSGKDKTKLENYKKNKPIYDSVIKALNGAISDTVYMNPETFTPVITNLLASIEEEKAIKKIVDKVVNGLSVIDKKADIQKDKMGNILYDTATKDIEIVPYEVNIEDYMEKEVLPHVPDAKWFFEENLSAKNPVVKIGAEIPFTRYFYKYQQPESSKILRQKFIDLEKSVNERILKLFKED